MRASTALLLAFALLPVAGCLSSDAPSSKGTASAAAKTTLDPFVNPIELEHDHNDLALHQKSNNIDLVGHVYFDNVTPDTLGEIDTAGDYAYVAVFGHGFAIVDLKDPAHPQLVSLTDIPALANPPVVGPVQGVRNPVSDRYLADLKVDKTGDWVFVAPELSETPGVFIYDARDRAHPKLAGFWAEPGLLLGCHMIEYATINEQEYLFCAPLDNAVYVGLLLPPTPTGQREVVQVARWVPNSADYAASEAGHLTADGPVSFAGRYALSGHQDMTYELDPITGKPELFVSFWNLGLRIVDVSIPEVPVEIGFWDGVGASDYRGNFHTAMAFKAPDGRRIAVAIPEDVSPPALFVLDASDIAHPKLLAQWSALPSFKDSTGNDQSNSFSLHNFQVVDGKIYICMGHGGIWVLDVSSPDNLTAPKPVGSYYPHQPRRDGKDYSIYPWDVNVWHGYMLDAEGNTGLYVLHFRTDPAGDVNYNGFA